MKIPSTIAAIFAFAIIAFAEKEVPSEFERLKVSHEHKIKKINDEYYLELLDLKSKCAKRGDLESANFIASVLEEMDRESVKPAEVYSEGVTLVSNNFKL
ncbi:hypothetical protein [Pontiella sulfatireligans]|uniref:Uncharacterized protein n=1 Tax=Pontiella sulfatireligans TaxID=2750658 RepID=A0A6C2UT19_9BACT|nr:hypothetical protein [Pontiella sulfatireligans]VGO23465.1 hypothetical protein SCARR_05572 [Pontiella sulfatireligans]